MKAGGISLGVSVLLVLAAMSGCGGTYDATAYGVVTLDGNPVSRGTVTFHPVAGGAPAYSPIGAGGAYSVHTGREEGLLKGDYQVTVTANEASAQLVSEAGGPMPAGKTITPIWYRSKESSGLKYTVESGSNKINLELTSQPPAGWNPGRQL